MSHFLQYCSPSRAIQRIIKLVAGKDDCCIKYEEESQYAEEGAETKTEPPESSSGATEAVVKQEPLEAPGAPAATTGAPTHSRSHSWPMASFMQAHEPVVLPFDTTQSCDYGDSSSCDQEDEGETMHTLDTSCAPHDYNAASQHRLSVMSFLVESRGVDVEMPPAITRSQSCPSLSRRSPQLDAIQA